MKSASALRQLGTTQQKMLRELLAHPQGATIEELCNALGITHNAIRQHLAALMAQGFVGRGESRASGGRPRMCYILQPVGRELFPRNYDLMAHGLIAYLYENVGAGVAQGVLADMGARLGGEAASRVMTAADREEATRLLAEQMDALGYEAQTIRSGEGNEVEAWNCVFHGLAQANPDVCGFDFAFIEAATGRSVRRTQCMLHGSASCRFQLGKRRDEANDD